MRNKIIIIFLISLILVSCLVKKPINPTKGSCHCDSIYDYSQPLNLFIDEDSNIVSNLNKVPFKHCLYLSNKKIIKNNLLLNPLLLNRKEIIGYVNKNQSKYFYFDYDFQNEELLFDFHNKNTSWIINSVHFKNYKIKLDEITYAVDTVYVFKLNYFGQSLSDNMYYSRIALSKKNFVFIEFSNGVKCNCLK